VAATRASFDLASPLLDQLLAVELVPQTADVVAAQIPELRDRRDRLRAGLAARLPHWRPNLPPGGLSLWVDLGGPHSSALAAAAEQHGVALTPGPRFGLDGAFERYVRLPYTLDGPTLDEVVERLAAASESIAAGEVPSQPAERGMA
jgi:aspartate/methionine/tyrosine aminotransferase